MILEFDTRGNEKQLEASEAWANDEVFEIYYGGRKGGGKSYLGGNLIFSDALTYPGIHCFIARKELSDLTKHTIPTIYEVFESWGLSKRYYTYNGTQNTFTLYNGSIVYLLYAKYLPSDPLYERFGSMQMTRGWIEEGGEFVEDAYKNLKISIGRWKNDVYNLAPKLLTTLNPKKNYIYRNVYKPFKNNTLRKDTVFIQASINDNKSLSESYTKNLENTLTGAARQRLLLGNWEYDDEDNSLLESYDKILDIFTINYLKPGKKYIIVDAARFGSDRALVCVFDELKLIDYKAYEISKTTDISNKIKDFQIKYRVPNSRTIVDSDGVGGGVVDEVGCVGFVNNASPLEEEENKQIKDKPNYNNLKSQCAFMLAKLINNGDLAIKEGLLPDKEKEMIIEELEQLKRKEDDNKLILIPKSEMKDNIARSPDWLDVFIMRMYFVIKEPDNLLFNESSAIKFKLSDIAGKEGKVFCTATIPTSGENYLCIIISKLIGNIFYIIDVVYTTKGSDYSAPIAIIKLKESNVNRAVFESNKQGLQYIRDLKNKLNNDGLIDVSKTIHVNKIDTDIDSRVLMQSAFINSNFAFRNDVQNNKEYQEYLIHLFSYIKDKAANYKDPANVTSAMSLFFRNSVT